MKNVHLIGSGIALAVVLCVTAYKYYAGAWLLSSDLMVALTGYIIAGLSAAKHEVTREQLHTRELEKAKLEYPPGVTGYVDDETPKDPEPLEREPTGE